MSTPTPLFAITAADIDAAGRSIEAELPVDWLDKQLADVEVKAREPGHLSARLSRSGSEIVVRGKTRVSLEAPCGRCLSPAKLDIEGELGLLLQPAKAPAPQPTSDTRASRGATGKAHAGAAASGFGAKDAEGGPKPQMSKQGFGAKDAEGGPKPQMSKQGGGKGKKPSKEKDLPEYEFASDEADVDTYDGETVVLDDFVREAILLEMPIFPLCSEDCPGIRPASADVVDEGVEPRVDPRLAPLGALRAALAQSKTGQGESNDDSGAQPRSARTSHRKKTK